MLFPLELDSDLLKYWMRLSKATFNLIENARL